MEPFVILILCIKWALLGLIGSRLVFAAAPDAFDDSDGNPSDGLIVGGVVLGPIMIVIGLFMLLCIWLSEKTRG